MVKETGGKPEKEELTVGPPLDDLTRLDLHQIEKGMHADYKGLGSYMETQKDRLGNETKEGEAIRMRSVVDGQKTTIIDNDGSPIEFPHQSGAGTPQTKDASGPSEHEQADSKETGRPAPGAGRQSMQGFE